MTEYNKEKGYFTTTRVDDISLNDPNKDEWGYYFDQPLCEALSQFFRTEGGTVVDLGCGSGAYTKYLRHNGISCDCYDGNPHTESMTNGFCKELDLAEKVNIKVYDWVVALEIGEHIPKKYEANFIHNLHAHNSKGVIVSWALEGQTGLGHVNEQDNNYIKKIFADLGYSNDIETEMTLKRSAYLNWFKNSVMVFKR